MRRRMQRAGYRVEERKEVDEDENISMERMYGCEGEVVKRRRYVYGDGKRIG